MKRKITPRRTDILCKALVGWTDRPVDVPSTYTAVNALHYKPTKSVE